MYSSKETVRNATVPLQKRGPLSVDLLGSFEQIWKIVNAVPSETPLGTGETWFHLNPT